MRCVFYSHHALLHNTYASTKTSGKFWYFFSGCTFLNTTCSIYSRHALYFFSSSHQHLLFDTSLGIHMQCICKYPLFDHFCPTPYRATIAFRRSPNPPRITSTILAIPECNTCVFRGKALSHVYKQLLNRQIAFVVSPLSLWANVGAASP